jgi:DNA polymerase-4
VAQPDILHVDLDAFYASVEQLLDPSLRGKPIAVGTGVVLASSYEAKRYGVQSGMPGRQARLLCPRLISVPGHFSEYQRLSDEVFAICEDLTPQVERISIDEAWLDVSGSIHLFGSPAEMAATLRRRVRQEIGLPISVGAARTKFLAKVASQVAKPDGLVVVEPQHEIEFLHPLPVELLWGVGPVTKAKLADRGIHTVGELAAVQPESLRRVLGDVAGNHLNDLSWNRDPRAVNRQRRAGSVGAQSALPRQAPRRELVSQTLRGLADRIGTRLRRKDKAGRTITVRVRVPERGSISRRRTLGSAIASSDAIYRVAYELANGAIKEEGITEISLLGISVSGLRDGIALQLQLPVGDGVGSEESVAAWELDKAIDQARARFGKHAVDSGAAAFGRRSVPDDFRELAEKEI